MTDTASLCARMRDQSAAIPLVIGRADAEALSRRPGPDTWSAAENLAHIARCHLVFLDRANRILTEDQPELDAYREERDDQWPEWVDISVVQSLSRIDAFRPEIERLIINLSDDQLARVGIHRNLGAMTLREWIEFFLLHEAHHLYVVMKLARAGPTR
jgi:uncharacterized damage-inducible protein DinB